ncbi:hypothetical protein BOTCAL_0205g00090 [Botryotinia calthae]|uniref:Uncharacterized protein n=1 Tax=Botryotinia calthae TaxID=38488 RepID=A0A4Y8D1R2_9HELO|nr:hypothetical protein BOTCAL_0205g00090 [Botryotinia calthae]
MKFLIPPIFLRLPRYFHTVLARYSAESKSEKRSGEEYKYDEYDEGKIASSGSVGGTNGCVFVDVFINECSVDEERGAGYEDRCAV